MCHRWNPSSQIKSNPILWLLPNKSNNKPKWLHFNIAEINSVRMIEIDMAIPNLGIVETIAVRNIEQVNTHQKWASHNDISEGFKILASHIRNYIKKKRWYKMVNKEDWICLAAVCVDCGGHWVRAFIILLITSLINTIYSIFRWFWRAFNLYSIYYFHRLPMSILFRCCWMLKASACYRIRKWKLWISLVVKRLLTLV